MGYFRPLSQTKFINDANLVAYYKLEDTSDSKNSYTLTNINSVAFNPAKFANGADFGTTNTNKILTRSDTFGMTYSSSRSYSLWVKMNTDLSGADSTSLFAYLVFASNPGNYTGLYYKRSSGVNMITTNIGTPYNFTLGTTWHHFTITHDHSGNSVKVYLDGVNIISDTSFTGNYSTQTSSFTLGGAYNNTINSSFILDDTAIFSRALSAGEVAELYQSMTLGEYLPNSSTKLLLHLNGSSADSSGNNNNGTDTDITYSQANGKFGQGAGFNGSSSKIQCTVTGDSVFTIILHTKIGSIPASENRYFIIRRNTSNNANYGLYINPASKIGMNSYNGSIAGDVVTDSTYSTGILYNIIAVFNGSSSNIYINGVLAKSGTLQTHTSGNDTFLGANSSIDFFTGSLDEVRIDPRAWSASEVKKYYTFSKGRFNL